MIITAKSEMLNRGSAAEIHSFETWEPNEDHAVEFTIPMPHFDPEQELPLLIELTAKNAKPFTFTTTWLGNGWKSDQQAETPAE